MSAITTLFRRKCRVLAGITIAFLANEHSHFFLTAKRYQDLKITGEEI